MPSFQIIHFVPADREAHILALPVTRILAIAHGQLAGTNHWCFYLVASPECSVQLDCQPSHSVPSTVLRKGSKANLILSELPYTVPPEAETELVLDAIPGLTVARVYSELVQHERHRYEFDADGVGCRFWASNQIDLFHRLGLLIDASQASAAKAGILKLWPDQTPHPLDQGAYY